MFRSSSRHSKSSSNLEYALITVEYGLALFGKVSQAHSASKLNKQQYGKQFFHGGTGFLL